jgi:hypothetical protein
MDGWAKIKKFECAMIDVTTRVTVRALLEVPEVE